MQGGLNQAQREFRFGLKVAWRNQQSLDLWKVHKMKKSYNFMGSLGQKNVGPMGPYQGTLVPYKGP